MNDSFKEEFKDEEYRYGYAESFLNSSIATQIAVIREQRSLTQGQLAELVGTKQTGISRIENANYSGWSIKMLKRIARALGCRLKVSFETFGTLLEEDKNFSEESLKRPKFEDDPIFFPMMLPISPGGYLRELLRIPMLSPQPLFREPIECAASSSPMQGGSGIEGVLHGRLQSDSVVNRLGKQ